MRFKLLPAVSALAGLPAFLPAGIAAIGLVTFLLITLATVLLSTLLLVYELRQYPTFLQSPSSARQPRSSTRQCLSSAGQPRSSTSQALPPAGKIGWGGFIGLNGLNCLTGNLIALSLAGLTDPRNLLLLSWLNVLVVPYVLFTVFYLRRAVKQWCIGCLGLPVVLAGAPLTFPDAPVVLKIIVLLVLPLLAARLQWTTYRKNEENGQGRHESH